MKNARRWFWMLAATMVLSGCDCCSFIFSCPDEPTHYPYVDYGAADLLGSIKLTWDKDYSDLDLLVVDSAGKVAYPDNKTIPEGEMGMDHTDGNGFGPEGFIVKVVPSGPLKVKVNYHWHYNQNDDVTATITIYRHGIQDSSMGAITHVFHKAEAVSDSSANPPGAWTVPGPGFSFH